MGPIEHFMVSFSKSYSCKSSRAGYVCPFWHDSSFAHWVNVGETPRQLSQQTPRQLSQCKRHQHLQRFHYSALTQLTWTLTPHWFRRRGVSLGVDSVDREWDSVSTELNIALLKASTKSPRKITYSAMSHFTVSLSVWVCSVNGETGEPRMFTEHGCVCAERARN